MTPILLLLWKLPWLQTEGPAWNRHSTLHIVLTVIIRLAGVDGPWLRQKLGISVLIKTVPVAKLLSWQQHNRWHYAAIFFLSYAL